MANTKHNQTQKASSVSLFGDRYGVQSVPFQQKQNSTLCAVFSGQGAVYPGMFLSLYKRFETFRALFRQADTLSKELGLPKVSDYIVAPTSLSQAEQESLQNICLFVAEVASFELLKEHGYRFHSLTSHSFGEYAALVCGGFVKFADMFGIVASREQQSPPKNSRGYLIAIEANEIKTRELLNGLEYHVANLNSEAQTVVAVAPEHKETILAQLAKSAIRKKLLETPQPYHSPYLNDMPSKMLEYLKSHTFTVGKGTVPVLSSVSSEWVLEDETKITELISKQMVNQVNFVSQIQSVVGKGATSFIEIGPATVLCPLIEANSKVLSRRVNIVSDYFPSFKRSQKKNTSKKSGQILGVVNQIISKVTGYEISDISVEDKFQDDLGIDSIKKTEIVFTVLDELKQDTDTINTSQIQEVGDLIELASNRQSKKGSVPERQTHFERLELAWRETALEQDNPHPLQCLSLHLDLFRPLPHPIPSFAKIRSHILKHNKGLVLSLAPSEIRWQNFSLKELQHLLQTRIYPFIRFVRMCNKSRADITTSLALVTQGDLDPVQMGLVAFFKSIQKENHGSFVKHIQLCEITDKEKIEQIATKELQDGSSVDVKYENEKRYIAELRPLKESAPAPHQIHNIVAIGGAKGITKTLLKGVCNKDTQLFLIGRSPEGSVSEEVADFRKLTKNVRYVQGDASNEASLRSALGEIRKFVPEPDLIINAAGQQLSKKLAHKSNSEIERELESKVLPAYHLDRICSELPTTRLIHFSSIVSLYGNHGQSVYALGNQFIDALTSQSASHSTAIAWPPWDAVGMTADRLILNALKTQGLGLLSDKDAIKLFNEELAQDQTGKTVVYFDLHDLPRYSLPLRKTQPYQNLLGGLEAAKAQPSFTRQCSLKTDPYLKDHQINGKFVLPGAVGIAQFFAAAKLQLGFFPVLSGIRFHQPIVIDESGTSITTSVDTADKRLRLLAPQLSFESGLETDWEATAPEISINRTHAEAKQNIYGDNGLFHGPSFQMIQDATVYGQQTFECKLVQKPAILDGVYGPLALWVDAGFQALGLVPNETGKRWLPTAVGQIQLFNAQEQAKTLVGEVTRRTPTECVGNVIVYADNHKPIAYLKAIGLSALSAE